MSDPITDLLAQVPTGGRSSKYMERLTDQSKEVLELFQTWLVTDEDKSEATARAYKNYVAQALCHIEDGGQVAELSTDVRSALNALKRFSETGVQSAVATAELPDDESDTDVADDIDRDGGVFDEDDVPA